MFNTSSTAQVKNEITYTGCVSVTLRTNNQKYKVKMYNTGTKHLLDVITRALAGYDISGMIPKYFDIQTFDEIKDEYVTALTNHIPFTGIVYGPAADAGDTDGRMLLNAVVTFEDKQVLPVLASPRMVILDEKKRPLAIIETQDINDLWSAITASTDAIIEWSLLFTN